MQRIIFNVGLFAAALVIACIVYFNVSIISIGGVCMIPIVMCSIFALAITGERFFYFARLRLGKDSLKHFEHLKNAVHEREWKKASHTAQAFGAPVSRVIMAGLNAREGTPQEIDEAMEEAAHDELPEVEKHLRWLSTLAQISTMLGLLGTVTGLVRAFQIIQSKSSAGAPVNPGDLAGGVWEALITTVAGLVIAIPTIVVYNYFAGRVGEVQFQMERGSDLITSWRRHNK